MSYSLSLLVICVIAMVIASPAREEERRTVEKRQDDCRNGCPTKDRCIPKDQLFEKKCAKYVCRTTSNGGLGFVPRGEAKCEDYMGNCVSQGSTFSHYGFTGALYTNCTCYAGGSHVCWG